MKRRNPKNQSTRLRSSLRKPEHLEARVVLAASMGWDGPGQGSVELTYYIANHPSSLSQAQTNQAIETALKAWSTVADITFTPTDKPGLKDSIDFSFSRIDGSSRTLAQAYYPDDVNSGRLAGDVQFDSAENWEVGNAQGGNAFDLVWTAVHEIGHSLGLDHNDSPGSVLSDSVKAQDVFSGLSEADKAAILALYASADSNSDDSSDSSSDNSTDNSTDKSGTDSNDSSSDSDTSPFPRESWRHGGGWRRFGTRLDVGSSYIHNIYIPHDVNSDNRVSPVDALMIINALNFRTDTMTMLEDDSSGLCDTNNDGSVTPSDALSVINAINGGTAPESVQTVLVIVSGEEDSTTDGSSTDSTSTDSSSTDSTSTDTSSESDSDEDCGSTSPAASSSASTEDAALHRSRHLAMLPVDALVTKYDADASGGLTETEVPSRLWQLWVDSTVDADADAIVTLAELRTAVTTARQELFNSKDSDSDGQIVSTEIDARMWSKLVSADTDASESVSFAEFDAWIASRASEGHGAGGHGAGGHGGRGEHHRGHRHGGSPELWRIAADALFERFDADSNQVLTEAELPTKIFDDLIEKGVDGNSDGSIASDELAAAITAARADYFTKTDSNSDGQLSQTETGSRVWRKLSSADSDANGTISLNEIQAWVPTKHTKVEESSASTNSLRVRGLGIRRR